jgi:hypothetical protein
MVQDESFKGLCARSKGSDQQMQHKSASDHFSDMVEIYQGAISTVFHATCNETGREVVLKAYHKDRMDNRHIARLLREIQAQQSIQDTASPHVCQLIDAFEDKNDYHLVLERCHGGDVFALQHENGGSLSESFVCTVRLVSLLSPTLSASHCPKSAGIACSCHMLSSMFRLQSVFLAGNCCASLEDALPSS